MLRRTKLIVVLICLVMTGILAASCAPSVNAENFTGQWEFLYGSQEELSKENVDMAKSMGSNMILTLDEDGSGSLDLYGDVSSLTWAATSDTSGSVTVSGSNAATMELQDELLVLSGSDDATLTFGRYVDESA